jgi:hypothetical protein
MLDYLVYDVVLPNAKAWVALLVTAANAVLVQKGVTVDAEGVDALAAGIAAVASAVLVWLVPNKGA